MTNRNDAIIYFRLRTLSDSLFQKQFFYTLLLKMLKRKIVT